MYEVEMVVLFYINPHFFHPQLGVWLCLREFCLFVTVLCPVQSFPKPPTEPWFWWSDVQAMKDGLINFCSQCAVDEMNKHGDGKQTRLWKKKTLQRKPYEKGRSLVTCEGKCRQKKSSFVKWWERVIIMMINNVIKTHKEDTYYSRCYGCFYVTCELFIYCVDIGFIILIRGQKGTGRIWYALQCLHSCLWSPKKLWTRIEFPLFDHKQCNGLYNACRLNIIEPCRL